MENTSNLETLLEPVEIEVYYDEVCEFILNKIRMSPSPEVACIMADFLQEFAREIFYKKF